ncbi:MAG: methyltransferase [Candidatus Pacearchaeota archaeon]|nr:methyltransferase [Candidatus Pacearchaeota archaeon]
MKKKIQFFSPETNKLYQLVPTATIPVLRISGVPMQRFTEIDPLKDTFTKIKALKPKGIVLDTCTGLGYTAIYSARKSQVKKVITIEKDPNVIEIAKLNPSSNELFENKKIESILGDSFEIIKKFHDEYFDCILHDPPTFVMAPELYSLAFYKEMNRVLKKGGKLWHYCPEPGKLKKKAKLKTRIISNLKKAGFFVIGYDKYSSGILVKK